MEIDIEDVPCWNITLTVAVSALTDDKAVEFLTDVLHKARREAECELWDWDIQDVEET